MSASFSGIALLAFVLAVPLHASAAQAAPAGRDGAGAAASCVDVQVGEARSVSYGCLTQQLAPDPRRPQHPGIANPALASERVTRLPPTQTGLFTSRHQALISGVKRSKK